ncbi:MAG TPA: hypothetical protein VGY58_01510 [Gemmataceae bacterium]|jgi:hypothetical protein|nr:hypothetical protein [Gemmataceae bacterium]
MSEPAYHAENWFREAIRSYAENHQGCPWCLGANRVYKSERNGVTEYRCGSCDFLACYDKQAGRYYMGPGKDRQAPVTMHAFKVLPGEKPAEITS